MKDNDRIPIQPTRTLGTHLEKTKMFSWALYDHQPRNNKQLMDSCWENVLGSHWLICVPKKRSNSK